MDSVIVTLSGIYSVRDGTGKVYTLGTGFSDVLTDIAVDAEGNIFVLTYDALYQVTDLANAELEFVMSFQGEDANALAFDAEGLLYVGFGNSARVDVVDLNTTTVVETITLSGTTGSAGDVEVHDGILYVTTHEDEVISVDLVSGTSSSVAHDLISIAGLSWDNGLVGYSGATAFRVDPVTGETTPLYGIDVTGPILGAATLPEYFYTEGTAASQILRGTAFDDSISGYAGDDTLVGGAGDDILNGGPGADDLRGGPGRDTAYYGDATTSVRIDLQNPAYMYGEAVGDTYSSIEVFQTGNTVDQLRGDAGDNVFYAGGLSDRLYGRAGDDLLFGEGGADAFYGGMGADTMTGGDDVGRRDRYIYFNIAESGVGAGNRDVITDFVSGEDRIEISRFDADTTTGGKQSFDFIGNTRFSGTAGELRYVASGGITLVQADVDGDGAADFEIELTGNMHLTVDDFLL